MEYKEIKKAMTQKEWDSENMPEYVPGKEMEANIEATCAAINNTYGKGINPEAVGDLLGFLKLLVKVIDGDMGPMTCGIAIGSARAAITRAEGGRNSEA